MLAIPALQFSRTHFAHQARVHLCASLCSHAPRQKSRTQRVLITRAVVAAAPLVGSQQFATLLGYAVLAGSCVRSFPQILRMGKNKSAQGVSLTSNIAELVAYTITVAYNLHLAYPFSSYGEIVACWLQDIVIIGLILRFNSIKGWRVWAGTAAFCAFLWMVMTGACGQQVLFGLQASTVAIIALGGRVPQIWMNYQRGNSGELSVATCMLNLFGNVARVYTTFVLTKDNLIMAGVALGGVLNAILLAQSLHTARKVIQADTGGLTSQPA
ncbi:hypothetical protein WJX77_010913 [Trebouxia sp. C0004]